MKTLATVALITLMPALITAVPGAFAQAQVPPSPPAAQSAQAVPSTEALAWAQKNLASWPEATRRLAAQLVTKYGQPAETTSRQVTWYDNAPWKRTTLCKDGPQHNFAAPHKDVLEQVIPYKVPIDKLAELAQFNRSVVAHLTRGELASTADSEDLNFLALNVAYDVIRGERTADQARTYYAQIVRAKMIREPERDLQKLKFVPPKSAAETADADEVAPLIKHMSNTEASIN
jgi:hypothetical protein